MGTVTWNYFKANSTSKKQIIIIHRSAELSTKWKIHKRGLNLIINSNCLIPDKLFLSLWIPIGIVYICKKEIKFCN